MRVVAIWSALALVAAIVVSATLCVGIGCLYFAASGRRPPDGLARAPLATTVALAALMAVLVVVR